MISKALADKLNSLRQHDMLRAMVSCSHCGQTQYSPVYPENQLALLSGSGSMGACDMCGIGLLKLSDIMSEEEWYLQQPQFL